MVGGALLPVLAPTGALVFMIATCRAAAGERPLPGAFSTLSAAGRPRLIELLKLGLAYLAAMVVAQVIFKVIDGDAPPTWMETVSSAASSASSPSSSPNASTPPAPPPLPDARMLFSSLLQLMLLILFAVPFWHAPALVFWGRQGWAKSLFFSTMAIWRNRGAFAIYGLGWFGLCLAFAVAFNVLLGVSQKPSLGTMLVFVSALSMYLTLMYTSLWFTVAGCFGIDAEPPSPPHQETTP